MMIITQVQLLPGTVGTAASLVEESHSIGCWISTTRVRRSSRPCRMCCAAATMAPSRDGVSSNASSARLNVDRTCWSAEAAHRAENDLKGTT